MKRFLFQTILLTVFATGTRAQVLDDRFTIAVRYQSQLYSGQRSTWGVSEFSRWYNQSGRGLGLDFGYRGWGNWETLLQLEQGHIPNVTSSRSSLPAIDGRSSSSVRTRVGGTIRRYLEPVEIGLLGLRPITPYAAAGLSVVSGRINGIMRLGIGPSIGAGWEYPLPIAGLNAFGEFTQVWVTPGDAFDLADGSWTAPDWLANLAFGIKYRFSRPTLALRMIMVTAPSGLDAGEAGWFTATVDGGETPVAVEWVFSDGARERGESVRHAFAAPGTYEATVIARGESDERTRTVSVAVATPTTAVDVSAVVTSPQRPRVGEPVAFRPIVRGTAFDCVWDFGDGETGTSCETEHTYTASGLFTWRLTVTSEGHHVSLLRDLRIETDRCQAVGRLRSVSFHPNSTELIPEMRELLRENLDLITSCPGRRIHIAGTASPDEQDAPRLANQRALAVFQYYRLMGIASDRFDDVLEASVVQTGGAAFENRLVLTELR